MSDNEEDFDLLNIQKTSNNKLKESYKKQTKEYKERAKKMKSDEEHHGETAKNNGANEISPNLKKVMEITANVMKFFLIGYRNLIL